MTGVQTCALPICFPVTIRVCRAWIGRIIPGAKSEPETGIEPVTHGLRNRCSTAELLRRVGYRRRARGAIEELTNMLITCFRLITEDEEFLHDLMIEYVDRGELLDQDKLDEVEQMIGSSDNVYKLSAWTKTRGNA